MPWTPADSWIFRVDPPLRGELFVERIHPVTAGPYVVRVHPTRGLYDGSYARWAGHIGEDVRLADVRRGRRISPWGRCLQVARERDRRKAAGLPATGAALALAMGIGPARVRTALRLVDALLPRVKELGDPVLSTLPMTALMALVAQGPADPPPVRLDGLPVWRRKQLARKAER